MFTAIAPEPTRAPRGFFDRSASEEQIALTPRDIDIFLILAERRFVSTKELQAIFGERIRHRLRPLFRHRYIDRPEAQRLYRRYRTGGGSNPGIYGLANRGAQVLRELQLLNDNGRDWSEQNRNLSPVTMMLSQPHEDTVAEVRMAFRRSAADKPDLRIGSVEDLTGGRSVRMLDTAERRIVPDLIEVIFKNEKANLLFVEVHRHTEPNRRFNTPELESIADKYERYLGYARTKANVRQFGVAGFRVLTVATGSDEQIDNIVSKAAEVTGGEGADRFLVTSLEQLRQGDAFGPAWKNAAGKLVSLAL